MTKAQKARKYWHNNIRKYRQRVLNQGRLEYRVDLPSALDGPMDMPDQPHKLSCYWVEVIYKDICAYCAEKADNVDHIVPLTDSGIKGNRWDNLTACCAKCNRAKYTKSLLHFLREVNLHV